MATDFHDFNLHPELMQAVVDMDYTSPTPIQDSAIPELMAGYDVMGQAQTGTGKTAAFALPMLQLLAFGNPEPQALVVTPTRELAIQVAKAIQEYGQHRQVRVVTVYGGQSYTTQIRGIKQGVDVVVGTPGRILDLIDKKVLDLRHTRYVVLDEADEMLSMGFIEDIESILHQTPDNRQTALFSATLPADVRRLANRYMRDPKIITTTPQQLTVSTIQQRYYVVRNEDKLAALARILEVDHVSSALIFARTRVGTAELADNLLSKGIAAEALHGDLSQAVRETVLGRFRRGKLNILVATDVAARGLDIDDISHVINYDIPYHPESYVHRIGRTARAGKSGIAITLVTPQELNRLKRIESYTKQSIPEFPIPTEEQVKAFREAAFLTKLQNELFAETGESTQLLNQLIAAGYNVHNIAAASIRLARAEEKERPIEEIRPISSQRNNNARKSNKQGRRRNHKDAVNAAVEATQEKGMVRYTIGVGKAQGVSPRDIVGAIASEANITGKAIGAIVINKELTYVDVNEKHANQISKKLKKFWIRGYPVHLDQLD